MQDDTPQDENRSGSALRYIPDWERLDGAVKRIVDFGLQEGEAQVDLCRAIADRRVHIRVIRAERKGRTWPHGTVAPPQDLKPADIDWENSRPNAKWRTGPMIGDYWSIEEWKERQIELVEVSTADVIDLFCPKSVPVKKSKASESAPPSADAAKFAQEQTRHATERAAATGGGKAKRPSLAKRIAAELRASYPEGKPAKKFEEIRRDLEGRPSVGRFSPRTLQTAISMAWPQTSNAA